MAPERPDGDSQGAERAPGDIGRGTQETTTVAPAPPGESSSQDFATSQSFADPAHSEGSPEQAPAAVPSKEAPEGGIRTQETGSEEGARTPAREATTTTSRESLEDTQEGEA